jgi:hypothetical protein
VYQLEQKVQQNKQQKNQTIYELFATLQEKIDELKLYRS